jgi:hypothetical protein
MARNLALAAVKPGNVVLHTVPQGNRHTLCGIVAEHPTHLAEVGPKIIAGTHRMCRNCVRVTPARDTRRPVDPFLSEPTDTWTVTDDTGREITRVDGATVGDARSAALEVAAVRYVSHHQGGFSLRRLTVAQLRAVEAVDALEESSWSTMTLATILHREYGLRLQGRRVICASLAARGITPERVGELNV